MNKNESNEWVSLRRAAEILGVHPATVRNWADSGKLPFRRTPGNHRRFSLAELSHYAQTEGELQPMEVQVIIQSALGQTRMQVGSDNLEQVQWYNAMSADTKARLRQEGRRVLDAIRQYLGAGAPDTQLSSAVKLGKEYAERLSDDGLTLPQALRGFFYFSDFVVNSILTWSELSQPRNSSEWANLLRQVNTYINTMLLSIVEYYEEE